MHGKYSGSKHCKMLSQQRSMVLFWTRKAKDGKQGLWEISPEIKYYSLLGLSTIYSASAKLALVQKSPPPWLDTLCLDIKCYHFMCKYYCYNKSKWLISYSRISWECACTQQVHAAPFFCAWQAAKMLKFEMVVITYFYQWVCQFPEVK